MKVIDEVLIVNNDSNTNLFLQKKIVENGFADNVKLTLNAGHALLYLEHMHLSRRIEGKKLLILLNMNTPIMNGIDFLKSFQESGQFKKENIMIVVMSDDLTSYFVSAAKEGGINYFVPFQLCLNELTRLVSSKFSPTSESKKTLPVSNNRKRKNVNEVSMPSYR